MHWDGSQFDRQTTRRTIMRVVGLLKTTRRHHGDEQKKSKHLVVMPSGCALQTLLIIARSLARSQHAETSQLPLFPERSRVTSSPRSRPSLWKGKENSHRPTAAAAARKSCERAARRGGKNESRAASGSEESQM